MKEITKQDLEDLRELLDKPLPSGAVIHAYYKGRWHKLVDGKEVL